MGDRILLEGLAFFAFHGARPEEKTLGQRFLVDLLLDLDLRPAGRADDLSLTVNYADVVQVTRNLVEGASRDTLEALAESLASALLQHFPPIDAVNVRVRKPGAPIPGAHFAAVGVEIRRARGEG